jgi:hypothetical protein
VIVALTWAVTLLLLAAAAYAHLRIGLHAATPAQAWIGRGVLLAVGVAFGALLASRPEVAAWAGAGIGLQADAGGGLGNAAEDFAVPGAAVQAFLAGFGLVHVPAAAVLWLKGLRARG